MDSITSMTNLSTDHLYKLLTACKGKDIFFDNPGNGILIRHDVDANLDRSVAMAVLEHQIGVKATYFILDSAPYFGKDMLPKLKLIQDLGHSIQWHNNSIAVWKRFDIPRIFNCVVEPLQFLRMHGFPVDGSASHGDKLCHVHGFINYEVFAGDMGVRTREAVNFKQPDFELPQVNPDHVGLKWEAYHVPYDEYYSESGGTWKVIPEPEHFKTFNGRIQLLIHPQWWNI